MHAFLIVLSTFLLSSQALPHDGDTMPASSIYNGYGCTGGNASPDLTWSGASKLAKSFVLTLYDPDAPAAGGWWHWVVFDIPVKTTSLPSNAGNGQNGLPSGAVQGKNSFGASSYGGPCPPQGSNHRYVFTLYALDVDHVDRADANTSGPDLLNLIAKHIISKTTLMGRYGR